jgi:hypothetical protein
VKLDVNLRPKLVVTDKRGRVTTLQPGPGLNNGSDDGSTNGGMDLGLGSSGYDGAGTTMAIFNSPCSVGNDPGFLRFSLKGLPRSASKAEVWVHTWVLFSGLGWPWQGPPTFSLRQVIASWNEMSGLQPAFASTGIDPQTVPVFGGGSQPTSFVYTEFEGWLKFDITTLYQGWQSKTANYGVALVQDNATCSNGDITYAYTSDWPRPDFVNGPPSGQTRTTYTYTSTGAKLNVWPNACFNPAVCKGSETAIAFEYQFDWGDGTHSAWPLSHCVQDASYAGYYPCTGSASHAWRKPGSYTVRARNHIVGERIKELGRQALR